MATFPLISVIVPTYNRLPLLQQALACLLQQTYPADRYEIVVVDDGSTDGTSAYLNDAADGAPLRIIRQANGGPAAARNAGVRAARGEWLAFTDDDCQVTTGWLAALARALAPDRAVGGPILPAASAHRLHRFYLASHHIHPQQSAGSVNVLFSCNMALHRRALLAAGGFDPAFTYPGGEDLDLSYRLQELGVRLTCAPGASLYHHYPTTWRAFTRHFWNHGQGMAFVFGKWPRRAPVGPARRGRARLEQQLDFSPAFPFLFAGWQALLCLGNASLILPKTWYTLWRSSAGDLGERLGNLSLAAYVFAVEQAGLVAGSYRWAKLERTQSELNDA
jgi:glycosyltransferase involved in cell wall biosynthesis